MNKLSKRAKQGLEWGEYKNVLEKPAIRPSNPSTHVFQPPHRQGTPTEKTARETTVRKLVVDPS